MVHWNRKYASPNVAAGEPDGLVVLGLFIEVGDEHPEFAKLIQYLNKIKYSGQKVAIGDPIDPANFLPSKQSTKKFWTYEGSLTTPPLLESVIWIVFQKPIQVSQEQVKLIAS
jgi:carbonic anhydrase